MLTDVGSGKTGIEFADDEVRITVMAEGHHLRDLEGKAFVSVRPCSVYVDDDRWCPVLGDHVSLPGGTEVRIDDERLERCLEDIEAQGLGPDDDPLIPLCVVDVHYPPVGVLVALTVLRQSFTDTVAGNGRYSTGEPSEHDHAKGAWHHGCRRCFLEWWSKRDKEQADG